MNGKMTGRPALFGEALFDVFPGNVEILGGAPFNVAWHLAGFGQKPLMISRVGDDSRGQTILDRMQQWGMDIKGIQIDPSLPTGEVLVQIRNGEPSFSIVPDRAYDNIYYGEAAALFDHNPPALVYHGTLAARSEVSRNTLLRLIDKTKAPVFLDVNLRPPWWDTAGVMQALTHATWVKLNENELFQILEETSLIASLAKKLIQDFSLKGVIVTRGEKGAQYFDDEDRQFSASPPSNLQIADTVGAGDAFSAVMITGLLAGWDTQTSMDRATLFGAQVCQVSGALIEDLTLYESLCREWCLYSNKKPAATR